MCHWLVAVICLEYPNNIMFKELSNCISWVFYFCNYTTIFIEWWWKYLKQFFYIHSYYKNGRNKLSNNPPAYFSVAIDSFSFSLSSGTLGMQYRYHFVLLNVFYFFVANTKWKSFWRLPMSFSWSIYKVFYLIISKKFYLISNFTLPINTMNNLTV